MQDVLSLILSLSTVSWIYWGNSTEADLDAIVSGTGPIETKYTVNVDDQPCYSGKKKKF